MTDDRAGVVARLILEIVARHLTRHWDDAVPALRTQITAILRDEIADIARETMNDIHLEDR